MPLSTEQKTALNHMIALLWGEAIAKAEERQNQQQTKTGA